MNSKTEKFYVKMFKILIEFCNENNKNNYGNSDLEITSDFEKG